MSGPAKYFLIGHGQNAGLNGDCEDKANAEGNGTDGADDAGNGRQAKKRPEVAFDRFNAFSGGRKKIQVFVHNQIHTEHQKSLGSVHEK